MKKILLVLALLSSPAWAVVQNPDGSVTLSEREVTVLMTSVAKTEAERDELMGMVNKLSKELKAEKSKRCI